MTSNTPGEQADADGVFMHIHDPDTSRSVLVDDDGRVAYAYLYLGDRIVSDVWLYNVGETPGVVDWKDKSSMPFKNPLKYCGNGGLQRLHADSIVRCSWSANDVRLYVDDVLWARLQTHVKPGWSINAVIDGPLAKGLRPD